MNGRSGNSGTRGFTLVELLVVVGIIILLAAILLPALFAAKTYAKESAIRTYLSHLSGALDKYHADFNFYPDSGFNNTYTINNSQNPANGTAVQLTNGSARLAEALMGYLGYGTFYTNTTPPSYNNDGDGAGNTSGNPNYNSAIPDPTYGFRMSTSLSTDSAGNLSFVPTGSSQAQGKIYGPYMTVNNSNYGVTPTSSVVQGILTDQYFVDPLGNRILYYKAHGVSTNPVTPNPPTTYFSTSSVGTGIFYTDDNAGTLSPEQPLKGLLDNGTKNPAKNANLDPTTYYTHVPAPNFLQLLGDSNNNNTIDAGEAPLDTTTYLLVSPGVSGIYFDSSNIINTK